MGINWFDPAGWLDPVLRPAIDSLKNGWLHNNAGTVNVAPDRYNSVSSGNSSLQSPSVGTPEFWGQRRVPSSIAAPAEAPSGQAAVSPAPEPAAPSSGPGDGGYGAMLNSINQQYQQQVDALNRNRDRAATDIASQYSNVQAQQRSNNAAYNGDASTINSEIMNRIAQQLADSRSAAADDAKFARAFGLNGAAIAANGANIARTNQNVSGYQQDLMRRLQMVQQGAQSNYANSAGLINQGATGRLTNTFNQALAAADLAKAEATAKAQAAASSAVSRASSGGSAKNQLSETKARAQLELLGRMDPATYAGYQAWRATPTTEGIDPSLLNLYGQAAMAGLT